MQVIPTINVKSFEEMKEQIDEIEIYTNWIQIDVADSTFTKNTIWHNPSDLLDLETKLNIEVHLMINNIDEKIRDWLIKPIKRIIFHLETTENPNQVIQKCKEAGKEAGIAIGPDVEVKELFPFCDKVDLFQILAVYPGLAGQKFMEESLEKIKDLRKNCPSAIIEVDGGIDKEVAQKIKEAGADIVASASYIFKSDNIKRAIKDLCI